MSGTRVLVVDDEAGVRFGIRDFLEAKGYEVDEADSCQSALEAFQASPPDTVFTDYLLPDGNAIDLLPRLKALDPAVPVVILTAHGSIELAVRAVKIGAEHLLTKPIELATLHVLLQRVEENTRNRQKQLARKSRQDREAVDPFHGTSAAIRELAEQANKVRSAESPVLIQGETGTGKGVLARWLHDNSPRADEAFVDLNCAGLTRDFLETELFGHEKGAFTGAVASKQGLLEVAHRGTAFLDEIGDVDLQVQPKLLKVLEEKKFRRMGEVRDRRVDIRLIAATHHDVARLVRENRFRSDLYFRISTIPLVVPPLRDRAEDIPLLARMLLRSLATDLGRGHLDLSPDAERALQAYSWPGNIRELRNVLERAVLLGDQNLLDAKHLRFDDHSRPDWWPQNSNLTLQELERWYIEKVLEEERGRVDQAASRLGIPRSSLYQKIKKHSLALSRF
ncbi:MAG TPA: sigma-54 dependent transcriptional regulator [Blastocatellia bacterium]|nr:sigma-54 dependent transcriptional regulator [Blastocatellia bacterium]